MRRNTHHKARQTGADDAHTYFRKSHKPRQQQVVGHVDTVFEIKSHQQYQANDTCNDYPSPGRKLSAEEETMPFHG